MGSSPSPTLSGVYSGRRYSSTLGHEWREDTSDFCVVSSRDRGWRAINERQGVWSGRAAPPS